MFNSFKTRVKSKARISWSTFSKREENWWIKNEIDEIKNLEEKIKGKYWKYYIYVQQFETIRSFGDSIYN